MREPFFGSHRERVVSRIGDALGLKRASLREEWARRIQEAELLTAMSSEEIFTEATAIYDNYVSASATRFKVRETGSVKDLQAYARDLSKRIIDRGVEMHEVLGIVPLLRDVVARSLFKKHQGSSAVLSRVFDAYEPHSKPHCQRRIRGKLHRGQNSRSGTPRHKKHCAHLPIAEIHGKG